MIRFAFFLFICLFLFNSSSHGAKFTDGKPENYQINSNAVDEKPSSVEKTEKEYFDTEDKRDEELKKEYCGKKKALKNRIELYKKDVEASRCARKTVSDKGFDEKLSKYKDAVVRLEGAEMELRALEDENHRRNLPIGWSRCQ